MDATTTIIIKEDGGIEDEHRQAVDPADVYSVTVVSEGGFGRHEVIVQHGLEGDGGEAVYRGPVLRCDDGTVRLARIRDHLLVAGFRLVEVRMPGVTNQFGWWHGTDFGYVATALKVHDAVATLNYDDEIVIRHSGEDVDLAVVGGRTLPTVLEVPASEEWTPEEYDKILRDAGWRRASEWTELLMEPLPVAAVEPLA